MRRALLISLTLLGLIVLAGLWSLRWALRASIPDPDAEARIATLGADVAVSFDALGRPEIEAATWLDAVRAQGFVHAQHRYFQMDLARRSAAGRLAELLGGSALGMDIASRRFGFGESVARSFEALPARHRVWLEAYAEGVNAGLDALGAPPFEYVLLATVPERWAPTDTLLVSASMTRFLSRVGHAESARDTMERTLPPEVVALLTPETTRFDAAPGYEPVPIPGPEVFTVRIEGDEAGAPDLPEADVPGSNAWVVSGPRAGRDGAILASDMHLGLSAPGTWYTASLRWRDESGAQRFAVGVTLPGVPGIVAGSNGDIAWGFTNVTGDFLDTVVLEPGPTEDTYLTPDGPEAFRTREETIGVRGRAPHRSEQRLTRWGPVSGSDGLGRPVVELWTGSRPDRVNIDVLDLTHTRTLEDAVAVCAGWYGPPQNCMLADARGRIAWVVSGWLPRRDGHDGRRALPSSSASDVWSGSLPETLRPSVFDPESGVLVTANERTLPPGRAALIGHNWPRGDRSSRIGALLSSMAARDIDEASMLALQNDTRFELYDAYRALALEAIASAPDHPQADAIEGALRAWDGTADASAVGLPLLNSFRRRVHALALEPLLDPCRAEDEGFWLGWLGREETVRRLLDERPLHLLSPDHEDWTALLRLALFDAVAALRDRRGLGPDAPWGRLSRVRVEHPLSWALGSTPAGVLVRWLDMPDGPVSGAGGAVRVVAGDFGASQRLVVSPGAEGRGILHIPAGQSGHPLSPWYRAGHRDWVDGRATPLLPGEPVATTRLRPGPG